jgi:hypothetical protein
LLAEAEAVVGDVYEHPARNAIVKKAVIRKPVLMRISFSVQRREKFSQPLACPLKSGPP